MARKPVPPSKNLAEQEAKRASKSTSSTTTPTDTDSKKEKKVAPKKAEKPKTKKAIAVKETVKDNVKSVSKPAFKAKPVAPVKKVKEKPAEIVPMTDKQITDAILESVQEGEVAKHATIAVSAPAPEPVVEPAPATEISPEPEGVPEVITESTDTTTAEGTPAI